MNSGLKAALINSKLNCYIYVRAALFHSSPVLDRKKRSYWEPRFNHYSRRSRRSHAKQSLLRNVNAYADFLFQSWENDYDEDEPSSSKGMSWFKKQYSGKGSKKNRGGNQGAWNSGRRGFQFCEDVDEETIFRSMFGGTDFFFWSFIDEENSQRRRSSNFSNHGRFGNWGHQSEEKYGRSWNWGHQREEKYETESDSENLESHERLALGLSASGSLTLEDVKNAYRISALKWHPDRHHGSSKAAAEERFKLCSAAYQSLCDKLTVN